MLKDRNFVQTTDRELGIISFRGLYAYLNPNQGWLTYPF